MHTSTYLYTKYKSIYLYVSIYQYINISIYLSICIHVSIYPYIFTHTSIYTYIHTSIYPYVHNPYIHSANSLNLWHFQLFICFDNFNFVSFNLFDASPCSLFVRHQGNEGNISSHRIHISIHIFMLMSKLIPTPTSIPAPYTLYLYLHIYLYLYIYLCLYKWVWVPGGVREDFGYVFPIECRQRWVPPNRLWVHWSLGFRWSVGS